MRVVFMGSPEFAVPSLSALAARHQVVAVYTQPDRVRGRGARTTPTPVKTGALALGLEVRTPETLRDERVQHEFAELRPEVVCVAAYGLILPKEVLVVPPHGCINVHASLLPRHRGAAPVHRAILQGDKETGVSIMRMEEGLDTGPFAAVRTVRIDDHDVASLTQILAEEGAEALLETLDAVENGTVAWIPQANENATYAAKVTDADVALDPSLKVNDALARVRASGSSARAKAVVCGVRLDIVRAARATNPPSAGHAHVGKRGLTLGFADGAIEALEVRPEGRGSMPAAAFACGIRTGPNTTWEQA
ncbi:MAG: methionyl-tRNA formyltransferase [Coriobacteriia bacterium]